MISDNLKSGIDEYGYRDRLLPAVERFIETKSGSKFFSEYLKYKSERYIECLVHGILDFCNFIISELKLQKCEIVYKTSRGNRKMADVDRVFHVVKGLDRERLAELILKWASGQSSLSNLKNHIVGVKNWLLSNGLDIDEELPKRFEKRIRNIMQSLSRNQSILSSPDFEWIPTTEDIRRLYENLPTFREKALLLLLAESGLRLNTALQLRFKDFTDGELRGLEYLKMDYPCYSIWVPREYSKKIPKIMSGHWAFIGPDARQAILQYVKVRNSEKEEEVTDDSFVFVVRRKTYNRADHKRIANIFNTVFRRTFNDVREIRIADGRRRISHHLHCLRKYAQSRMEEAGLHPNIISYLLGRSPEVNLGKNYSRHDFLELRESYLKVLPHLIIFERLTIEDRVYEFKQGGTSVESIDEKMVGEIIEKVVQEVEGKLLEKLKPLEDLLEALGDQPIPISRERLPIVIEALEKLRKSGIENGHIQIVDKGKVMYQV